MRQTGFLEWKRVSTSIVVPFMIGLVQWRAGLSFPINIAITFSSGLLLYGLLILVERWVRIREVIAERLDTNASAIQKLDQRIAELETPQFTLDVDRVAIAPEMPTTSLHIVIRLDVTVLDRDEARNASQLESAFAKCPEPEITKYVTFTQLLDWQDTVCALKRKELRKSMSHSSCTGSQKKIYNK